ncbi:50S ribosomal protein L25/general stress protein Ctc [Leucobacter luti]|uniref:Large ribosomal subunit protein bL25 n=1 Tax=Leucobacter luti TaxID=340320 RepID=A0A4R6S415_9MICO|nr:50S ribosomal protein L25/general stress protein Ctc [Leucobacter luti]MCW2287211.1 large subunit ribosomal protein L25 [Leucobacter luti]QYM76709.1 50S ribosomal protein L25/general stress protein Ctc [Leucobacter luti]TCK41437.1 LSU ribosomal protein L25P [Leucobacter luti]TDP94412.1 LSU ribosomal protein L25P [Leucobacter luti]
MTDSNKLVASTRETFGKGVARKLRAIGQTPVVVYGHGTDPVHLSLETHPLSLILRQANALIELDIDGKSQLVLVKDVQRDPVRQIIEHVDLIVVKKGDAVEVEVHVHVVGESFSGTNALQELNTLRLSAAATSIPESVEVNVEGLEDGTQIHAGDIELPKGATLLDDPAALVVNIVAPRGVAEDAEGEAAAE